MAIHDHERILITINGYPNAINGQKHAINGNLMRFPIQWNALRRRHAMSRWLGPEETRPGKNAAATIRSCFGFVAFVELFLVFMVY